jgi:tungstate transport system ATP-binding protein
MSQVILEGITRSAGDKTILRDVSLEIEKGETLAIIGPSGSGKTSLLRIINLLDRPDDGKVIFDGRDARAENSLELRRSMAMVFQKPVPFSMNVYDNIAYGLRLRHFGHKDRREALAGAREVLDVRLRERRYIRGIYDGLIRYRHLQREPMDTAVRDALALLDMQGRERQYARSLSGGEAQRLAFARAFVLKPGLLLLDEPTANLDPANARIIERAITDVNKRYGTTVILVTHNVHQARRLCKASAFMMDGEIVEFGETGRVLDTPRDLRTKQFVSGDIP